MNYRSINTTKSNLEAQYESEFVSQNMSIYRFDFEKFIRIKFIRISKSMFSLGCLYSIRDNIYIFVVSDFETREQLEEYDIQMTLGEIFTLELNEYSVSKSIRFLNELLIDPGSWKIQHPFKKDNRSSTFELRFSDVSLRYTISEISTLNETFYLGHQTGGLSLNRAEFFNLIFLYAEGFRTHLQYFVPDTIVSDEKLDEYTQALKHFKEKMYDPLVASGEIVEIEQPKLNL